MFWKLRCEEQDGGDGNERVDGRFVLHQHADGEGPHLDLRLEQDGYLVGWRIEGVSLEGEAWATQKAPHPTWWLERDGDAVRLDAGLYTWIERGPDRRVLALRGGKGVRSLRVERESGLPVAAVRSICEALRMCGADPNKAGQLLVDGMTARKRVIERLCGLGRELDGTTFDDGVWRRILADLSLEEIHAQLRGYEVRFDMKYPPAPVSRPERLPGTETGDGAGTTRTEVAMAIVRE